MSENVKTQTESLQIDVRRLWNAVIGRWWLVALTAVACAVLTFIGTFYLVEPQYSSSAMFYVNNNSLSVGDTALSITSSDISAAKNLVDSYIVILKTRASLNEVIDYSGVDRTYSELRQMVSAASVSSTEVFEVVVTSPDPQEAEKIANAIAYILPKRIAGIVEGTSAKVVDYAIVAATPSSPSYPKSIVFGFLLGFAVMVACIVIHELFDVTIRSESDVEKCCSVPVLAAVPDMATPSKESGYSYGKYGYSSYSKNEGKPGTSAVLAGKGANFAAAEAYKLLRTKLQFSFTSEVSCPVVGVSSALVG